MRERGTETDRERETREGDERGEFVYSSVHACVWMCERKSVKKK